MATQLSHETIGRAFAVRYRRLDCRFRACPTPFAPSVVAFVTEHVRTLAELQLLIAIIQSGDRWWDAGAAARESGLSIQEAGRALDYFGAHNLLDVRITRETSAISTDPGHPSFASAPKCVPPPSGPGRSTLRS